MPEFVPPHNKDLEETVLGSILYEPTLIRRCILSTHDFYFSKYQKLYGIFAELQENKAPIDLITVGTALQETEYKDSIIELSEFMSRIVSTANFSHYEEQIKELSLKRELIKIFIAGISGIDQSSADQTVTTVRQKISEAMQSGKAAELVSMKELAREMFDYIERRVGHTGILSGVPSGLKDLDDITDGFQGSDLIILAGRPGSGKSALAGHIIQHAAGNEIPAGFISLEMGKHQLGIRSLASLSGLSMRDLQRGIIAESGWPKITRAAGMMGEMPAWFAFSAFEAKEIAKVAAAMVEEKGCKLLVLDYLQLARVKEIQHREREVALVSNLLKSVAKTYNIPVIALAQLNREVEKEKRKPRLADLRESGAIEQDADVVIFLHKPPEEEDSVEVIIGKGRNIGIGGCKIGWDRSKMIFRDLAYRKEDE